MTKLVARSCCHRCCQLVDQLSDKAKANVIMLHGTKRGGFIGLGDVVEAVIHALGLHKVWAVLHGQKTDWVCPACKRRKTWLNKLWYFGSPETKRLWCDLVGNKNLAVDAEYPFVVHERPDGSRSFSAVPDWAIKDAAVINEVLERQCNV